MQSYFTRDQLQQARRANLYDYLTTYHPTQFRREGRSIRPKDNNSISIRQGYSGYTDFASGETGNGVDYLVRYLGYSVSDAVIALCKTSGVDGAASAPDTHADHTQTLDLSGTSIVLPAPADSYKRLFAYLSARMIPANMIKELIRQGLIYQECEHNNIVFVNPARDWAEIRGTYTYGEKSFHGIATGSRSDGFWWYRSAPNASTAYVCEAAIDAVSLYLLHRRQHGIPPAYYISIGGVSKQQTIDRIKRQSILSTVVLAVDNDDAGQRCRNRNADLPAIVPFHKDWNDDL